MWTIVRACVNYNLTGIELFNRPSPYYEEMGRVSHKLRWASRIFQKPTILDILRTPSPAVGDDTGYQREMSRGLT